MNNASLFLGRFFLQNHKIVGDSVCIFAYDIPGRNRSTLQVTVVRRSYDNLMINRKIFCKSGPRSGNVYFSGSVHSAKEPESLVLLQPVKFCPLSVSCICFCGSVHFICCEHFHCLSRVKLEFSSCAVNKP